MENNSKSTEGNDETGRIEKEERFLIEQTRKVSAIRRELTKETDRGCALMAASFLDNELMILLESKLVGSKKFKEELFEFNGPLGSFSSRIKLAFALGFISKEIKEDLDLIRKVRNEFGHKYEALTFETEPIKSWILGLKQTYYKKNEAEPRSVFNNTVLGVLASIHVPLIRDKPFQEKKNISIPLEDRENIKETIREITDFLKGESKESNSEK